ncbi:hypothetical protein Acy02nite_35220 [Actinoplanes cyaneus]|uniref:BNR repeat-containing family member n=1 Tax=Actinoplanes cyaneus TaxID=52696 RepID=A0A919IIA8_9ACTN|nr:BNR-4 repeat-containing protein [Actinoplanes cyaneus]GID65641.1 hypothetical protein Acy02nite_35220 [Actinoplanes cyaneus]
MKRRTLLAAGLVPFVPTPSRPSVTTVAAASAARTDRRPVAGGVHDPYAKKTFISWAGFQEDNYVQEYDHRRGTWSAPVRVAGGDNDSHNYPTLIQAGDGHLLVFRGLHNRELWVARSPEPHSIAGTWTDTIIPEGLGATYPMPVKTATGDIFVFIRETAGDFDPAFPTDTRPMKYVRSTDNGHTWQSSATLTGDRWCIAPLGRPDNMNEIYLGQLRLEPDGRIAMVWTLAGGGPEGHLHDRYHRNIYHATFSPDDLRFRSAAGHDLGTTVDDADQERHLKVATTPLQTVNPRSPDYISLVGSTLGGRAPFVVWMRLDEQGTVHTHSAVHLPGTGWHERELGAGVRVRDMEPADALSWRIHTTPDPAAPGVDTYRLVPGLPWRHESTLATPRPIQRIEVIAGHRAPVRLLLTGASSARDVSIADGDVYVA